jgi:hypothetical protein
VAGLMIPDGLSRPSLGRWMQDQGSMVGHGGIRDRKLGPREMKARGSRPSASWRVELDM